MIVPRFCLPTAMLYLAELLFQLGKLAAQTMPSPEIQRRIDNVYARGRSSVGFSLRGDDGSACRCSAPACASDRLLPEALLQQRLRHR